MHARVRAFLTAMACLVAGTFITRADERTWSDRSGKYRVTGTLVRETDGEVQIRSADGRLVRIEMSRLSQSDREFIAQGGRPESQPTESQPATQPRSAGKRTAPPAADRAGPAAAADVSSKEVLADGEGGSKEEALRSAFRTAIRQVVGEVVDSDVQVRNDRLIKDEILTYSDGFIPHHDVVSATVDTKGVHRITIRAVVERRRLVSKLKAAKVTVKELDDDGESSVGKIWSEREARDAAKAMVTKAFIGFPSDQLEARVLGWRPEDEGDHITVAVKVEIAPSLKAYDAFQQRLCQRLADVAKLEGEFATVMEKHPPSDGDPCRLPSIGKQNYFTDSMPRLMPDIEDTIDRSGQHPKWPMVIAVATLMSKDHTRIDWRYFVLDGVAGDVVYAAARLTPSCKLSFLDDSGTAVAVDRFDPSADEMLAPQGTFSRKIPWDKYAIKLWRHQDNENRFFGGLNEYERNEGNSWAEPPRPAMAFVAPVFFGSGYTNNCLYVPKIILTRHVRLTEEEVLPVKQVRCEMTFRKPANP